MIGRDTRKADLVYQGIGKSGQDLAVDVSIGDSSVQSYLHNSSWDVLLVFRRVLILIIAL
jgi:hypothetical protein